MKAKMNTTLHILGTVGLTEGDIVNVTPATNVETKNAFWAALPDWKNDDSILVEAADFTLIKPRKRKASNGKAIIWKLSYDHNEHGNCISFHASEKEAKRAFAIALRHTQPGDELSNRLIYDCPVKLTKKGLLRFLLCYTPKTDNG